MSDDSSQNGGHGQSGAVAGSGVVGQSSGPAPSASASAGLSSASTAKSREPSIREIYFPQNVDGHRSSIFVASFPEIIYFWPTLLACFFAALLQGGLGVSDVSMGWMFVLVVGMNLLVLVQDFDQKQFVILLLALVVLGLGAWILQLYGIALLGTIAAWIFSFQPSVSTDGYLALGSILLCLMIWGLITPLFSYWRLEQNEFVHYSQPIGKDMSIARMGCTVYKEIPDVFQAILTFGGGSLVIRRQDQILATIPHIPFLGLRMRAIEHMLSETRVVVEKEG